MGKIYSINCIQLVLRDAFFNGGKLNFLLLELCPSRELLTDLISWCWLLSRLLLTYMPSDSTWTIHQPSGDGFLLEAALAAAPQTHVGQPPPIYFSLGISR